VGNSPLI
jgi:hypothetical protein